MPELFTLLLNEDPEALRQYLLAFGILAPLVSFGLMLLQAVVAPLPAFVITLGNGMLWGGLWGGLLSLISGVAAAWLGFELARRLGRDWVRKKVGERQFDRAQAATERWGFAALVVMRLIPFLPFDPISYAMGLSPMGRRGFLAANLLGQAPGSFFYAMVGAGVLSL